MSMDRVYRDWIARPGDDREKQTGVSPGKRTLTAGIPPRAHGAPPAQLAQAPRGSSEASAARSPGSHPGPAAGTQSQKRWLQNGWMDAAHRGVSPAPGLRVTRAEAPAVTIQAKAEPSGLEAPASAPRGGGSALPGDVESKMAWAFGTDLSHVRIHEGSAASEMGALAFTQGADIHFAPGQYQPHSQRGQELLGHELTHVIQQSRGQVHASAQAAGVAINDNDGLEQEADAIGAKVARGERVADELGSGGSAPVARVPVPQQRVAQRMIDENKAQKGSIVVHYVDSRRFKIVESKGENAAKYLLEEIEKKLEEKHEEKLEIVNEEKLEVEAPQAPPAPEAPQAPLAPEAPQAPLAPAPPKGLLPPPSVAPKAPKTGGSLLEQLAKNRTDEGSDQQFKKELWVASTEIGYGLEGDENALKAFQEAQQHDKSQHQDTYGMGTKTEQYPSGNVFPNPAEYSFEWWFNYLWAEVPDSAAKEKIALHEWVKNEYKRAPDLDVLEQAVRKLPFLASWISEAQSGTPDPEKLEKLQQLLGLGFIRKDESDFAPVGKLSEGPQGENTQYHKTMLPPLNKTGLVYRSDSRNPETIRAHGGSKPRSRLDQDKLAEMNMDKPWNPFSKPIARNAMWLRKGKVDNDLNTVVSLAVDPRDAVKFPLPGSSKTGGEKVSGESDHANLYIIWIHEALDTTGIVQKELEASPFGRGELGAVNVPNNAHLVHIETERAFAEGNVAYVAGAIHNVTLIQPDSVYLSLPFATRQALVELVSQLNGGSLGWLVHGTPEQDNKRHEEIEKKTKTPPSAPKNQEETKTRLQSLDLDSKLEATFSEALTLASEVATKKPKLDPKSDKESFYLFEGVHSVFNALVGLIAYVNRVKTSKTEENLTMHGITLRLIEAYKKTITDMYKPRMGKLQQKLQKQHSKKEVPELPALALAKKLIETGAELADKLLQELSPNENQ